MPRQLTDATAGQQSQYRSLSRQLQAATRLIHRQRIRESIQERMTDIQRFDPSLTIKLLLKRKNDQELSDIFRNRSDPAPTPGPYLRTDKVDDRDAQLKGPAGEPQVKVRKIYKDHQIRASVVQAPDYASVCPPDSREPRNDLDKAHHSQVVGMCVEADAGLAHPVSPDSLYDQVRDASPQFGDNTGSMLISGRFACNDHNPAFSHLDYNRSTI